mmetsp:Transcript_21898/g.61559  ORF Transcript_21898/g.61559 Transcript_21898/m.61559 type:complete len:83 (-) Transcript_21898:15-263(-)
MPSSLETPNPLRGRATSCSVCVRDWGRPDDAIFLGEDDAPRRPAVVGEEEVEVLAEEVEVLVQLWPLEREGCDRTISLPVVR